jgi:hypothetical protein
MKRDAEWFEMMLRTLLKGEIDFEDVCGDFDRIHSFRDFGMLTRGNGLVVILSDGKRIIVTSIAEFLATTTKRPRFRVSNRERGRRL